MKIEIGNNTGYNLKILSSFRYKHNVDTDHILTIMYNSPRSISTLRRIRLFTL